MKTYIFLAAFLVACVHIADKLVDSQFKPAHHENVGYTKVDRDGMRALVIRAMKPHKMTDIERAKAMIYLYGGAQ